MASLPTTTSSPNSTMLIKIKRLYNSLRCTIEDPISQIKLVVVLVAVVLELITTPILTA